MWLEIVFNFPDPAFGSSIWHAETSSGLLKCFLKPRCFLTDFHICNSKLDTSSLPLSHIGRDSSLKYFPIDPFSL